MSAFLRVRVHLIWSTHNRQPRIARAWRNDLYGFIRGIGNNLGAPVLKAGGTDDHVHVDASLPATLAIADLVNALKANSSRWVHENHDPDFAWQTKYAAFSVSKSAEPDLLRYIEGQDAHHRHKSFVEELEEFLRRHEIPYDPKYYLE